MFHVRVVGVAQQTPGVKYASSPNNMYIFKALGQKAFSPQQMFQKTNQK